ncbi:MAG TPA: 4'-phosphopantetheinyl transferase superfamily protein [Chitinophagaceae bacterium]|nr:4'-phosphopantetheinyl transferase superfamily protein [Chitinophagaceae bacterium]
MPLYKEWNPDLHSLAAIWHITEAEDFFRAQLPVSGAHIIHAKRRIEFLAGRFLLQHLNKDFPLHAIVPDEHDKPQLPGQEFHFSVSHSYPYVACVISTKAAVGIDIQCWHRSILALQHKFLAPVEQQYCANDQQKITLAWSAKEAAYKWQGRRGVDFIGHLPVADWQEQNAVFDIKINLKLNEPHYLLQLKGFIFKDFALALAT